jgi:hypothetical protein
MIDRELLHALADNELTPEERTAALAEMQSDEAAQAEYHSILAMKDAVKSKLETPDADALWQKCRSRFDEIDKTKRVEAFVGRYAWGICGLFFVAILVGGVFNRSIPKSVQPNDVAGYVASMSPVPVTRGESQAALEPELKQVVGEAFRKRPAQMFITGRGHNNIPGERTSFVRLTDDFGNVAVMALYDVRKVENLWDYDADTNFKCAKFDDANALFWNRDDGVICMVIGQRSYNELYEIVQNMRNKN